jgi:hypothetical protein
MPPQTIIIQAVIQLMVDKFYFFEKNTKIMNKKLTRLLYIYLE